MEPWVLWVIAAVLFAVGEVLTLSFFLAPFAAGALVAAGMDVVGGSAALQWVGFLVVSIVTLGLVRPIARSHKRTPPQIRTGTAALVGREAKVLERIANHEGSGTIKLDGGDVWTARSYGGDDDVIEAGKRVQVVEIRGATALVTE